MTYPTCFKHETPLTRGDYSYYCQKCEDTPAKPEGAGTNGEIAERIADGHISADSYHHSVCVSQITRALDEKDRLARNHADLVYMPEIKKLQAENAELEKELAEQKALVQDLKTPEKEWLCDACNTIYPGPPKQGLSCVLCPKCGGDTAPKDVILRRRAERALSEQKALVKSFDQDHRVWCDKHDVCHAALSEERALKDAYREVAIKFCLGRSYEYPFEVVDAEAQKIIESRGSK